MTGTGDYAGEKASTQVGIRIVDEDRVSGVPRIIGSVAGDGQVEVRWALPDDTGIVNGNTGNITKYKVYWGTTEGVNTGSSNDNVAEVTGSTAYTITSMDAGPLPNDAEVYFVVTAWNAVGESLPSAVGKATPTATIIPVTGVVIDDKRTTEVDLDGTLQLSATIEPSDATDQRVSWSSSDESVATVDASFGLVTPQSVGGPVTITVTSIENSNEIDTIVKLT